MALRQRLWAARARQDLLEILGGECVCCGSTEALEFDCIAPRGDAHHRAGVVSRISFYRAEHFTHRNLQILCRECHKVKSRIDAKRTQKSQTDYRRENLITKALQTDSGE